MLMTSDSSVVSPVSHRFSLPERNLLFQDYQNGMVCSSPCYTFSMTETNARPGGPDQQGGTSQPNGTSHPGSTGRPGRHGPMSGRQAEAARNDQRILESARAVFVADPGAPITAVAKHAGVGISALYTRYGSKAELLRTLCTDGLLIFVRETGAAIERVKQGHDHWQVFADFMRHLTDADTSSLTRAFAGKFAPTPE